MLKAAIFDMDGILVDSTPLIWSAFEELLSKHNIKFSQEYIKKNLARSLRDNLLAWQEEYGIPKYDLAEFSGKTTTIQMRYLKDTTADKNLVTLLEMLKREQIPCIVATSSHRSRAEVILNQLKIRPYFQAIIGAEDVQKHKPDPEVFLRAAKHLNTPPQDCFVIEDAYNGILAAKRANMKAIGKRTAYNTKEDFASADMHFDDFSELTLEKLESLF